MPCCAGLFFLLLFCCFRIYAYFCRQDKKIEVMTAIQLNAEVLRNMSIIAEDENLLKRAAIYLRKLVAEKEAPTLISKEEFFASLDRGEEEYRQGKTHRMLPGESLDDFLKRVG